MNNSKNFLKKEIGVSLKLEFYIPGNYLSEALYIIDI